MKNMKLNFLGILVLLLLPINVFALTGNVKLSCNSTELNVGESTTCTLFGNIEEEVSTVSAKIKLGDNLSLVSVTTDAAWEGDGNDGNITLYTDNNKSGKFTIVTFVVKALTSVDNFSTFIGVENTTLSDANFKSQTFNVENVTVNISTSVNTDTPLEESPQTGYVMSSMLIILVLIALSCIAIINKYHKKVYKI